MNRILLKAMGIALVMQAAETHGGGGKTRDAKNPEPLKETPEHKAQVDAEVERLKGIEAIGAEEANAMIEKDSNFRATQVDLWLKVATYPTEAQAKAYRDGFERACKTKAESGGVEVESANAIKRNVSIFNRIIRAIYGWNRRIEGSNDVERVYAEKMTSDVEANRFTIQKALKGSGTWAAKLDMIPKQEDAGGRPIKPEADKIGDAYRKTIAQAGDGTTGDASKLANVLRVPTKVGKETVPENKRQSLAIEGLIAAMKAAPDSNKGALVETTIGICLVSSDKVLQDWAIGSRDLWSRLVLADTQKPSTVVTRRSAEVPQE